MDYIPIIDLKKITGSDPIRIDDFNSIALEAYRALSGIGFAYLLNHGINKDIVSSKSTAKYWILSIVVTAWEFFFEILEFFHRLTTLLRQVESFTSYHKK